MSVLPYTELAQIKKKQALRNWDEENKGQMEATQYRKRDWDIVQEALQAGKSLISNFMSCTAPNFIFQKKVMMLMMKSLRHVLN